MCLKLEVVFKQRTLLCVCVCVYRLGVDGIYYTIVEIESLRKPLGWLIQWLMMPSV